MRVWYLIFILLLATTVVADDIDITVLRSNYGKGETLQFEVNANSVTLVGDLQTSNIKLKDSNSTNIDVPINLIKLSNTKYYVNLELPFNPGNYKIVLEEVRYTKGDQLVKVTFEKNLAVNDRNGLAVRPGIVYLNLQPTDQPKLNFKLVNTGNSVAKVNVSTDSSFMTLNQREFEIVLSQDIEVTTSSTSNVNGNLIVQYGEYSYRIPVYLFKQTIVTAENTTITQENQTNLTAKLEFYKDLNQVDVIDVSLDFGKSLDGIIYFKNTGGLPLNNLKFTLTGGLDNVVAFDYSGDLILEPGEVAEINVTVNPLLDKTGNYQGDLEITSDEGAEASMPFILELKERLFDPVPTVINLTGPTNVAINTKKVEEKESNWALWLFIVVLLIIVGFVIMFYLKSKNQRKHFGSFISSLKR